jgi:hypothetical protein
VLIRAPHSWPPVLVATVAMLALAAVDLLAAVLTKEAVTRRSGWLALLAASLFVVLFWIYASSLQYAELAPVTFGWIVALQIGVVLVDRFHNSVRLPAGAWLAIGVMLVAQAYLIFAVSGAGEEPATAPDRAAAALPPVA